MSGIRTRFEMNPGKSCDTTGVLPNFTARARVASVVSGAVAWPGMISTSFMSGTGFMKCIPITLAGRPVTAAMRVIDSDEVLLASTVAGGQARSRASKIDDFRSNDSLTASTTQSQGDSASRDTERLIRPRAASLASFAISPFSTSFARLASIPLRPRSRKPCSRSVRTTFRPEAAATCAIPEPICPAPTTPNVRIAMPLCELLMPPLRPSDRLDRHGHGVSAAEAEGRHPLRDLAVGHGVHQGRQDARAAAADRVPERHGPAVHVDPVGLEPQLLHERHGLHRERLVELVEPGVFGLPAGLREDFLHRLERRHHHHLRLEPAGGVGD